MHAILTRYSQLPGNRDLVFKSLCSLLAENPADLDWTGFQAEDWELLGKMAADEGIAETAYYLLRTQPETYSQSRFDPQTFRALAAKEAVTAVRNAVLFKQLGLILRELTEYEIPVVLLKGSDLAQSLYPEPGLRPMTDLDLLVPEANFKAALALVNNLGYYEYLPEASPGLDRLLSHHAHLRRQDATGTLLELHWTLIGTPAFRHAAPMDWFWQNLEPNRWWQKNNLNRAESIVYNLNPTANLLYLAAHQMLQHGGELASLRWLLDLHRLIVIRGKEIDWESLKDQADQFGWSGALSAALEQIQACFGTHLPDGLLPALKAEAGTYDALIEMKAEQAPTRILGEWKKISSLNWQGRIRLIFALIFPGGAYMRWRYNPRPAWIWPLYYLCDS